VVNGENLVALCSKNTAWVNRQVVVMLKQSVFAVGITAIVQPIIAIVKAFVENLIFTPMTKKFSVYVETSVSSCIQTALLAPTINQLKAVFV
jgi:hypothetical protein